MPNIEDFLLCCIAQRGDRYVFGTEASPLDPDPDKFDCSELMEWAAARSGGHLPDGAYYQWRHCVDLGMGMPVAEALATRGVLLFHGDGTGVGRDAITHVACSIGDYQTIEARGAKWGVGTWASPKRFQFAARIPGYDYSPRRPLPPKEIDMRPLYFVATVRPPVNGMQLVPVKGVQFHNDITATIKANDNGSPVKGTVQVCKSFNSDDLVLSFIGLDGKPVAEGSVGVVLALPT